MARTPFDATAVATTNLLDRTPVVPGSTVSTPLLEAPRCKLVLFAMDAGQSISEHRAPFPATVQVLDGRLRFEVAGSEHELHAHDWLVMPADAPHELSALEPTRFLLTLLK